MRFLERIAVIAFACILSACAVAPHTESDDSLVQPVQTNAGLQPKQSKAKGVARIRFFGQNAVGVKYFVNKRCVPASIMGFGDGAVVVSGGLGDAFASFAGTASNTSIGMPETPNTTSLSKRDGMLSKAYFREYEVKAGEPITIRLSFSDVPHVSNNNGEHVWISGARCRTVTAVLVPEEGKDYEVALDVRGDHDCEPNINEIRVNENKVTLVPASTSPATRCK